LKRLILNKGWQNKWEGRRAWPDSASKGSQKKGKDEEEKQDSGFYDDPIFSPIE